MEEGPTSLHLLALLLEPGLRQELREACGREAGVAQLGQHVAQVGPRVHAEPVTAEHQGVSESCALTCGVAASEQVVVAADGNQPDEALHLPVVQRQATVLEEAAEGEIPVLGVGDGLAQRSFGSHLGLELFQQGEGVCVDGGAFLQAQLAALLGRQPALGGFALDGVQLLNVGKHQSGARLSCPESLLEAAPSVHPARHLRAGRGGSEQGVITRVAVGLNVALTRREDFLGALPTPVRSVLDEEVAALADVGPEVAAFDAARVVLVQHAQARVVRLDEEVLEGFLLEPLHQGRQYVACPGQPVSQCGGRQLHSVALVENGLLAMQRQPISVLAHQQLGQQAGARQGTRQRGFGGWRTDDTLLAPGAGELGPLLHLDEEARRLQLQPLADFLAHGSALLATAGAGSLLGGDGHHHLAPLQVRRQGLSPTRSLSAGRRLVTRAVRRTRGKGRGRRRGRCLLRRFGDRGRSALRAQEGQQQLELVGRRLLTAAPVQLAERLLEPLRRGGVRLLQPGQEVHQHLNGLEALALLQQPQHVGAHAFKLTGSLLLPLQLTGLISYCRGRRHARPAMPTSEVGRN
ncbi:hypothetical protein STIAU_1115 [Stigmatella aurantiaca DW4/3-1]|uniref:Uncharacterized protein n=1 Tax=Stigmatella aurantiaca (strain DW4/3-1) TaxID=378806 RepID=Q08VL1_STIAD|nr:hypothetical protein STIAU_1115 [Stigmatella aurantiaca DW4/3-1]